MSTPTSGNLSISISKEQLQELPLACYRGGIVVVDTLAKAANALDVLNKCKIVGFDTETKPSFKKGKVNRVALIQISTDSCCYLFRVNKLGIFEGLCKFIENPDILKIGLSLKDDFHVMHRSSPLIPGGFVDLQDEMQKHHIVDIGLQRIYGIMFGERISKGQRLSNWEADRLTANQQAYAALDAWACLRIYDHLNAGRFNPNESPYILPDKKEEEEK